MHQKNRIQFQKPDLVALNRQYAVADLHFHSHYSDGKNSIAQIAAKAKALEIGIGITDHNDIRGAVEINQYKDLFTIPGIEITSQEGTHLLVYFYDIGDLRRFYEKEVYSFLGNSIMSSLSLGLKEVVCRARAYHCVIIFPHPYCAAYTGIVNHHFSPGEIDRLIEMGDGVEVINAGNVKKWNLQSAILGFNLNQGITGGSDGHTLSHMGRAVTFADCKKQRRSFLNAIKNRQSKVVGKEIDLIRKVTASGIRLKNGFSHYPDLMGKNFRYGRMVIRTKSKLWRASVSDVFSGGR